MPCRIVLRRWYVAFYLVTLILSVRSAVSGQTVGATPLPMFGECRDSAGNPLPEVFLELFSLAHHDPREIFSLAHPDPKSTVSLKSFGIDISPLARATSGAKSQDPLYSFTADKTGFWAVSDIKPGQYLVKAQFIEPNGSKKLSTHSVVSVIGNEAEIHVPLVLDQQTNFGTVPNASHTQTIYFATDRLAAPARPAQGPFPGSSDFANDRGTKLVFGSCTVEPDGLQLFACTLESQQNIAAAYDRAILESPKREGVIYIHGFNVSFSDAIRTGGVLSDASARSVFVYDWPSYKKFAFYSSDEENLAWTLSHSQAFLISIIASSATTPMSIMAHSLGTRGAISVLQTMDLTRQLGVTIDSHLRYLAFAAADLDTTNFEDTAPC